MWFRRFVGLKRRTNRRRQSSEDARVFNEYGGRQVQGKTKLGKLGAKIIKSKGTQNTRGLELLEYKVQVTQRQVKPQTNTTTNRQGLKTLGHTYRQGLTRHR